MDVQDRLTRLLTAPIGVLFMVGATQTDLDRHDIRDPRVCFHLATEGANLIERWNTERTSTIEATARTAAALRIGADPIPWLDGVSWWFDPIGLDSQVWVSLSGGPPDLGAWGLSPAQKGDQTPDANTTSTLRQGISSEIIDLDHLFGITPRYPMACWRLNIDPRVRVFEIEGPEGWHDLCLRYPVRWNVQDRWDQHILVPDWRAVAEEWDGVHLSFGGWLTTEQVRYRTEHGESMMEFWNGEKTFWLRPIDAEFAQLPPRDRDTLGIRFNFAFAA